MTEKNIFVYKLFLLLNISDFILFFMYKLQPPEKSHPLFPINPPLKIEILSTPPPVFENCRKVGGGGGGAHYGNVLMKMF